MIPSYSFDDQLSISNYPKIRCLILDKMAINIEGLWLQYFIEKTRTLEKLSLVEC